MTKKNQARRFFLACEKWLILLGLGNWELTTRLVDLDQDVGKDWRAAATVDTRPEYHSIIITGDEKVISNLDDVQLEETACHEVIHAVLAQMDELTKEIIEQLPKGKREVYASWHRRELEEVATRLEAAVLHLHKAPRSS